ncbi:MAG: folate family ECF transporter S component [Clostridia bacterium]|nr:folate family ECF transporter S component [Clostridia bacterium]
MFKSSFYEMKKIKTIVLCGLMIALGAAIEAANPLNFGELLKIRLDFAATAVMGFVAGPVAAPIAAAVGDVIRYIIKPAGGAFFPGYTLSAAAGGFIYGILLYKKGKMLIKKSKVIDILLKCFLAKLLINLFVNVTLNSIWVYMTTGKALAVLMPARIIKNAVALPFEVLILFAVIYYVNKYLRKYI